MTTTTRQRADARKRLAERAAASVEASSSSVGRELLPETTLAVADKYRSMLLDSPAVKVAGKNDQPYKLRNGTSSRVYVDHGLLLCDPGTNALLVEALATLIRETIASESVILCNVDSKSSPHLAGAIATRGGYRQIVVNPDSIYQAENGTNLRVRLPFCISPDDHIVVVDDVLTGGDQTAAAVIELVRATLTERLGASVAGSIPIHVVAALNRDTETTCNELGLLDVRVHWLASLDQILEPEFTASG